MPKELELIESQDYKNWLKEIKSTIRKAQIKASLSVNSALIELYWNLGEKIVEKQRNASWGDSIIEKLARDLKWEFPQVTGFSRRNLYAVKQWYLFYSMKYEKVPQAVAQIPWGHNRLIISKIKDIEQGIFYSQATVQNGWSRDILELQIESKLFERKGKSLTNFERTLPKPQSDLARETLKDPYIFNFLELEDDAQEREIEKELTRRITQFILELGKGFAFVGSQYKIEIDGNEYFIDLLFYHLNLRSYVVIELKAGKFKPEYAGKLNFYLSAVDSQLKKEDDKSSIGIILCKSKNKIEAEYALRDINKPIGISDFKLTHAIPEDLKSKLPTVEELEKELCEKLEGSDFS